MPEVPKPTFPDWLHNALSFGGLVPEWGVIPNMLNAILYYSEGRVLEMGFPA